jgi:glycine/D-amino acid oxidase-like deaminating enzyme
MADDAPDVLVVGAGVVGLACAFRLVREGRRVLLLDREQPGFGASHGNAGHIATEQIFPLASPSTIRGAFRYLFYRDGPLRIRPAYFPAILPWLLRFTWASRPRANARGVAALSALQKTAREDLSNLLGEAGASHLLHLSGHLLLIEDTRSTAAARKDIAELASFGIHADWLGPPQVREMAPEITANIAGALQFTGTGHVDDPHAVSEALAEACRSAGGKFIQAEVVRIDSNDNGFTAHASTGARFGARQLVLSCGAWSKALASQLGYPVPLDTERGYQITLPGVAPRFRIPIASFERKIIMTPMSMGLRVTGCVEFGGLELEPDPRRFDLLARHVHALASGIPTGSMTTWMGFRPSLPDHLPVLGRVPDGRNCFFAFGHQHLGLTLAGVTARIVAAEIGGSGTEVDLKPFAPDRF